MRFGSYQLNQPLVQWSHEALQLLIVRQVHVDRVDLECLVYDLHDHHLQVLQDHRYDATQISEDESTVNADGDSSSLTVLAVVVRAPKSIHIIEQAFVLLMAFLVSWKNRI